MDVVRAVCDLTAALPREEHFVLVPQMLWAAISVPSNIAEGYGDPHLRQYLRHLSIASGSLRELETRCHIARRRRYLFDDADAVFDLTSHVGRLLRGLRRSLGDAH